MERVASEIEIVENALRFDSYSQSKTTEEKFFFRERLRLGKMFVHLSFAGRNFLCPSRFAGYQNNSRLKHGAFGEKHGKTNARINSILGKHDYNEHSEKLYLKRCTEVDVSPSKKPRSYWRISRSSAPRLNLPPQGTDYPDEALIGEGHTEGGRKQVVVNAYERNPKARAECVSHYGASCFVCDFDFGFVFGQLGKGFIHVHHLRPISDIGKEYRVDPISDLKPVCPNCHAMLHRSDPPFSIEELREIISQNKD